MNMKLFNRAAAAAILVVLGTASVAHADYAFSGTGGSGTLVAPSETWSFNFDGGALLNDWGSPGVGAGVVAYGESQAAFGMTLNFTGGGTINAASVGIGNGANCAGSTSGGTTFCTISPTDIWIATITGPSSIKFIAQNSTFFLTQGQTYFVNVFFDGATPTDFTGAWLTTFSGAPEPATWAMMLVGFGAIGYGLRRRSTALAA
jgi:hypothetical protein